MLLSSGSIYRNSALPILLAAALYSNCCNATGAAENKTVRFSPTQDAILNPERGYVSGWDTLHWDPVGERGRGRTMTRGFVNLAKYRDSALDGVLLNALDRGLERVRAAHIKTTLRFKYNDGEGYPHCPEARESIMLQHLSQLAPTLQKYSDVIVSQEAGFIGCWGEWSGESAMKATTDEREVLTAMLKALPGRLVQVRSPIYKSAIYDSPDPIKVNTAFSGTDRARIGEYNDCILSTQDGQDLTYPTDEIQFWMTYVTTETHWLPMGGETCGRTTNVPHAHVAASSCTQVGGQAQDRLAIYHFSYINVQDVVQKDWRDQGCFDEIGRDLGYRLVLSSVGYTSFLVAGESLHLDINIRNEGYAAVFNSRPVYAVLDGNGNRFELRLNLDPRRWAGKARQSLSVDAAIPASVPAGSYRLSLWLPDSAKNLRRDPLYAIRFANEKTWDAPTGLNVITESVRVSAARKH
jgi:hypothetical protein